MARRDTFTADLFDWKPSKVAVGYDDEVAGRGNLDNKIARLVSRALRDARDGEGQMSRAEVAALMSLDLGRSISEATLDKWSSAASDTHRISLDAFIALVKVTESDALLGFIPSLLGYVVVPKQYDEIIQLYLIEQKQKELSAAGDALKARLRSRK